MMFMDVIHVHVEEGGEHDKVWTTFPFRQMITYEWCMKAGAMLNPPYTE
jgi:hypothetical protein